LNDLPVPSSAEFGPVYDGKVSMIQMRFKNANWLAPKTVQVSAITRFYPGSISPGSHDEDEREKSILKL